MYVIVSDGDLMEGLSLEAIAIAGAQHLSNLIVVFDDNSICSDSSTSKSTNIKYKMLFESLGWHSLACDGHDFSDIKSVLSQA